MQHDMLYMKANAFIPTGKVTSTARLSDKWHKRAKPGDVLVLRYTEGLKEFGRAVVVRSELVSANEVIDRAAENHTGQRELPPGEDASTMLSKELHAAYGDKAAEGPYSMVHFIRINGS